MPLQWIGRITVFARRQPCQSDGKRAFGLRAFWAWGVVAGLAIGGYRMMGSRKPAARPVAAKLDASTPLVRADSGVATAMGRR